jgi:hypothetical protein
MQKLLTLASALAVATTLGAASAKADPPWMRDGRGPGPAHHAWGPPGHHYGWKRGRHLGWGPGQFVPPGWRFRQTFHPYAAPPRRHHGRPGYWR